MSRAAWIVVLIVVALYSALTVRYASHWTSDQALWGYTSQLTPTQPFAVVNRAIASHQPVTGFVYEDWIWTQACQPSSNSVPQHPGIRGIPRSLAQGSWCWQVGRGDTATTFHLVNLSIHLLVAVVLGLLVRALADSTAIGVAIGALFAVHPLVTESAVYLAGRGELIAGLGVVLACLAVVHRQYMGACLAVCLGILGKESAIVALVAVPLVLYVSGRVTPTAAALAGLSISVLTLVISSVWHLEAVSLHDRLAWVLLQSTAAIWMVVLSVVPLWQSPMHVYGYMPTLARTACLVVFCGLGVWAWTVRATTPLVACGLGWIVLTALPRLVVPTPPSVLNEHQWYVPLMGFAFIGADRLKAFA